jgi:hypothetical protein
MIDPHAIESLSDGFGAMGKKRYREVTCLAVMKSSRSRSELLSLFVGILSTSHVFVIGDAVYAIQTLPDFTFAGSPVTFLPLPLLQPFIPGPIGTSVTTQTSACRQQEQNHFFNHRCSLPLKNMIKSIVLSNKYLNEDHDEPLGAPSGSGLERL